MGATGASLELPVKHLALLLAPEDTVVMMVMRMMMDDVNQEGEHEEDRDNEANKND